METKKLIPVEQFCSHYNIEFSFIESLHEYGLVQVTKVEETRYISLEEIHELEKMIRLHYELDINIEGIDAIAHLLRRVDQLQHELNGIRNRLRLYESE